MMPQRALWARHRALPDSSEIGHALYPGRRVYQVGKFHPKVPIRQRNQEQHRRMEIKRTIFNVLKISYNLVPGTCANGTLLLS